MLFSGGDSPKETDFFARLFHVKLGVVTRRVSKHNAKEKGRKAWVGEQRENQEPSGFMPAERIRAPGKHLAVVRL